MEVKVILIFDFFVDRKIFCIKNLHLVHDKQ